MPLRSLRAQAQKLDRRLDCIVSCEDGSRAAAGAFILASLGFRAQVLAGGLRYIDATRLAAPPEATSRAVPPSLSGVPAAVFAGGGDGGEIARLRARIRELETENARLRAAGVGAESVQSRTSPRTEDTHIGIAASKTIVQSSVSVPKPVTPGGPGS